MTSADRPAPDRETVARVVAGAPVGWIELAGETPASAVTFTTESAAGTVEVLVTVGGSIEVTTTGRARIYSRVYGPITWVCTPDHPDGWGPDVWWVAAVEGGVVEISPQLGPYLQWAYLELGVTPDDIRSHARPLWRAIKARR